MASNPGTHSDEPSIWKCLTFADADMSRQLFAPLYGKLWMIRGTVPYLYRSSTGSRRTGTGTSTYGATRYLEVLRYLLILTQHTKPLLPYLLSVARHTRGESLCPLGGSSFSGGAMIVPGGKRFPGAMKSASISSGNKNVDQLDSSDPTLVRAYTVWPSRNTFCCYGHCMTGPKEDFGPNTCAWSTILGIVGLFFYVWGFTLVCYPYFLVCDFDRLPEAQELI